MTMRVSDKGLIELVCSEGVVPYPYLDSVGVWTYGVGHTAAAGAPDPKTMPRGVATSLKAVVELFREDLKKYEDDVNRAVKVPLTQHQFDALVHWHYNTGAIKTATLTKRVNAKDWAGAGAQFLVWNKPKELVPRREKERDLFENGVYSNDGFALVYTADKSGQLGRATREKVSGLLGLGAAPAPKPTPVPAPAPVVTPPAPDTPTVTSPPVSAPPTPVQEPLGFWSRFFQSLSKRLKA